MSTRPPITFSRADEFGLEYVGSRAQFRAKYLPLCRCKWKLYHDGVLIDRYVSFAMLTPAAMRHEAKLLKLLENLT